MLRIWEPFSATGAAECRSSANGTGKQQVCCGVIIVLFLVLV